MSQPKVWALRAEHQDLLSSGQSLTFSSRTLSHSNPTGFFFLLAICIWINANSTKIIWRLNAQLQESISPINQPVSGVNAASSTGLLCRTLKLEANLCLAANGKPSPTAGDTHEMG